MKKAGMILGLVGSAIGLALSIIVLAAGASLASDLPGLSNAFVIVGVIDIVVCAIAIVGASITPRAPIAGAVMMMVVGAVGFVLFSPLFWIASFVLLVTGGVLAIIGRNPCWYNPWCSSRWSSPVWRLGKTSRTEQYPRGSAGG
jgi:hypothetical protein